MTCLTPQDEVIAAYRPSQWRRDDFGAHCARMWQGGAAVQQLYSCGRHPQARVQILAQDRHRHGPGHAQVGLLQDPLPGAGILALHGAAGYEPPLASHRLEAFQDAAVTVRPWCPPGTAADPVPYTGTGTCLQEHSALPQHHTGKPWQPCHVFEMPKGSRRTTTYSAPIACHVPNCPQREASTTSGQMYRQSTSEAGICSAAPLVRLLACCGLLACRLASLSCFVFGWNCTQHSYSSAF